MFGRQESDGEENETLYDWDHLSLWKLTFSSVELKERKGKENEIVSCKNGKPFT